MRYFAYLISLIAVHVAAFASSAYGLARRALEAVDYGLAIAFPATAPVHVPVSDHPTERQIFGPLLARVNSWAARRAQRDPLGLSSGLGMRIAA